MATMTCRSTFAFDAATIRSIRSLARRWRVSQAEAVRRAVAAAEDPSSAPGDPFERLAAHRAAGGLSPERAGAYLAAVRRDRAQWRGRG